MEALKLGDVVVFLNSLDERRFGHHADKAQRDQLRTAADFKRWLVARSFLSPGARVTASDARAARVVRDHLRGLVAGDSDAAPSLTAFARRYPLLVSFDPAPRLAVASSGVAGFLGAVVAACATAAIEGRFGRLKMCAAPDCRFVFYDRGRNRMGRWCAMPVCGNRMKARAYRVRHARAR